MNRWIVCAANRHRETGRIICGARHFDTIMRSQMNDTGGFPYWNNCEQGFIDQRGDFLTREEAKLIAEANCQIGAPRRRKRITTVQRKSLLTVYSSEY